MASLPELIVEAHRDMPLHLIKRRLGDGSFVWAVRIGAHDVPDDALETPHVTPVYIEMDDEASARAVYNILSVHCVDAAL